MSDIADTSSKPSAKRDARTDEQAFAQVEKWMAMIRSRQTRLYKMNRLRSAFLARSPMCFCT